LPTGGAYWERSTLDGRLAGALADTLARILDGDPGAALSRRPLTLTLGWPEPAGALAGTARFWMATGNTAMDAARAVGGGALQALEARRSPDAIAAAGAPWRNLHHKPLPEACSSRAAISLSPRVSGPAVPSLIGARERCY